ncbi:MAG: hypothetical protein J1F33_06940 [Clostridiales bacterium]|nr:hypothetical protein [Clostridiales bacterium]
MKAQRSLPGGILGIIGSVFCIFSGLSIVACARATGALFACAAADGEIASEAAIILSNKMLASGLMCMLGAIGTLVGAILDFKKPIVGGCVIAGYFVFMLIGFALNFQLIATNAAYLFLGIALLIPSIITSFVSRQPIEDKPKDQPADVPQNSQDNR